MKVSCLIESEEQGSGQLPKTPAPHTGTHHISRLGASGRFFASELGGGGVLLLLSQQQLQAEAAHRPQGAPCPFRTEGATEGPAVARPSGGHCDRAAQRSGLEVGAHVGAAVGGGAAPGLSLETPGLHQLVCVQL